MRWTCNWLDVDGSEYDTDTVTLPELPKESEIRAAIQKLLPVGENCGGDVYGEYGEHYVDFGVEGSVRLTLA